jgi:hypothetical protein
LNTSFNLNLTGFLFSVCISMDGSCIFFFTFHFSPLMKFAAIGFTDCCLSVWKTVGMRREVRNILACTNTTN